MSERKSIAEGAKKLETPGLVRQVETHLIFGPLSRHFPLGYIALACIVIFLVAALVTPHQSRGDFVMITAQMLMFSVFVVFFVLRMTLRQQAILLFEKSERQMLAIDLLMAVANADRLRGLNRFLGFLGHPFEVHEVSLRRAEARRRAESPRRSYSYFVIGTGGVKRPGRPRRVRVLAGRAG